MRKRRGRVPHESSVATTSGEGTLRQSPVGQHQVSFRTGRLEPRLAWAIAAFTVWAGVIVSPGDPVVWLMAIYAGVIGGWCRINPARHPSQMLMRAALLLLLGAFLLQVGAEAGATNVFFIWPIMVTTVYSLLLAGRWAHALWALASIEFAATLIAAPVGPSWQFALVQAGMQCFFTFVASEFGRGARELDRQDELTRRDRDSRLYNEAGFFAHGGELFDDCRRRKRPFSMVLLNSADLREVADLAGKKAANQLFEQLVQHIGEATPNWGLAARTDAVEFGLALPGVTAVRAAALVREQLGQPPKIAVRVNDATITVMLDSVIAEASGDVPTLEDMYDRLRVKLLQRAPAATEPGAFADHSTLQGMLEPDAVIPHSARPTMPMSYGEMTRLQPRQR